MPTALTVGGKGQSEETCSEATATTQVGDQGGSDRAGSVAQQNNSFQIASYVSFSTPPKM